MLENIQNALLIYNLASGRRRHRRFAEIEEAARILNSAGIRTELAPTTGRGTRHRHRPPRRSAKSRSGNHLRRRRHHQRSHQRPGRQPSPHGAAPCRHRQYSRQRTRHSLEHSRRRAPDSHEQSRRIALGAVMNATPQGYVDPSQGCRYFLCVAGAGPDGAMVHAIDPALKDRTGIIAYWAEGVRQLVKYRFPEMSINRAEFATERHADRRRPHRELRRPVQNHHRRQPLRR